MKGLVPDLSAAPNGHVPTPVLPGFITLSYDLRLGLRPNTPGTHQLVVYTNVHLAESPVMLGAEDFADGRFAPTPTHRTGFIGGGGADPGPAESVTAAVCARFGSPDTRITVSGFAITITAPHLLPGFWQNDQLMAQEVIDTSRQLQQAGVAVRVSAVFTGYGLGGVNFSSVRPVKFGLTLA